ncbi:MAG: L,D-transpeptidase [Hyphomicrobiaceae bacterium]
MRFWQRITFASGFVVLGAMGAAALPAAAEVVDFPHAKYPPGSIVIVNRERRLYHVWPSGKAKRYKIAVGVPDEQWVGREIVTNKRENPRWIEPDDDGEGEVIEGGEPHNPLGKRALYLGRTLWRIHGTSKPRSIGRAVSNGCIRMHNDDVIELYEQVAVGTEVYAVTHLGQSKPQGPGRKLSDD